MNHRDITAATNRLKSCKDNYDNDEVFNTLVIYLISQHYDTILACLVDCAERVLQGLDNE